MEGEGGALRGIPCSEKWSECVDVGKAGGEGDLKPDDSGTKVSRTNTCRLAGSYCNLRVSKDQIMCKCTKFKSIEVW